jgi:transcriptional regulator with XRE-family HTH domain
VTPAQEIGARIRQLRIERGLSVEQFACAVFHTPSAVRNWETGRSRPRSSSISCIERAMGVTILQPGTAE